MKYTLPLAFTMMSALLVTAGNDANASAQELAQERTQAPMDLARRGIVTIESHGRALGFGIALGDDGRIVTALSALPVDLTKTSSLIDARFADGSVVHVKLGHRDTKKDLALLVPLSGKWTEGLKASELDLDSVVEPKAFVPTRGGSRAKLSAIPLPFSPSAKIDSPKPARSPTILGAPILDDDGNVVAIVVRSCDPTSTTVATESCLPRLTGAPVSTLRQFLVQTPESASLPSPWLGIAVEAGSSGTIRGVRVIAIAEGSPAKLGGLRASDEASRSDLIVAVDGKPVEAPEDLAERISAHAVGESVKLLLFYSGKYREKALQLRSSP